MYLEILSKLVAESLLSFYSIFVKKINVPLILQVWSRFFTYVLISSFFIDFNFVYKNVLSTNGILISFISMIHVYTSYRSFQLLDSGVATTLFYIYPLLILLFSGAELSPILLFAFLGVYLLASEPTEPFENIMKEKTTMKEFYWNEGIISAFMAAFTEAFLFFMVKNIKTMNNWNHLFLSYFFGAIGLTLYLWKDIISITAYSGLSLSLIVNAFIGLVGYYLRFFAISRLDASIYAPLSYFGIVMSYIYGVFLNNDTINIRKIVGTLFIIGTNLYIVMQKHLL
jgi:drug/metabolite transporter (DMT)-like permease